LTVFPVGKSVVAAEQYQAIGISNGSAMNYSGRVMEYSMPMDFITNQIDETIGKNLRKIRAAQQVSVLQVARWLNADEDFVTRLERGQARLRAAEMFVLAEHFGVRISKFFCGAPGQLNSRDCDGGSPRDLKVARVS
jgi:DNA-binding transcriptional regulator YiaG